MINFKNVTIYITHFYSIFSSPGMTYIGFLLYLLHKLQSVISRKHFADLDYIASFSFKSPDLKACNLLRFPDTCE
jgi:hypothetical protein